MRRVVFGVTAAAVAVLAGASAVWAGCTISTTPVSFGIYNVFATTPLDTAGGVTYICDTQNENVVIHLDRGGAATFAARRMLKGSEPLSYNLHLDSARTQVWGDGSGGTVFYLFNKVRRDTLVPVTVFGRIPAGQDVTAGSYTNTVIATIIW